MDTNDNVIATAEPLAPVDEPANALAQAGEPQLEPSYEQLLAKITHPKQRAFLQNYFQFRVTSLTAQAIGIDEQTPYQWAHREKTFQSALSALKKRIDDTRLQQYEAELDKRILVSPSKQSDILLMFALKALEPGKYRENFQPSLQLSGDITVKLSVPPYTDSPVPLPMVKPEAKQLKQGDIPARHSFREGESGDSANDETRT